MHKSEIPTGPTSRIASRTQETFPGVLTNINAPSTPHEQSCYRAFPTNRVAPPTGEASGNSGRNSVRGDRWVPRHVHFP